MRVLICDDDEINRELLTEICKIVDMETVTVENGEEALDAAGSSTFDLLLLDYHMPGMNGMELAEKIREGDGPNCETPIVIATADVSVTTASLARFDVQSVLTKPFLPVDVTNVFNSLRAQ